MREEQRDLEVIKGSLARLAELKQERADDGTRRVLGGASIWLLLSGIFISVLAIGGISDDLNLNSAFEDVPLSVHVLAVFVGMAILLGYFIILRLKALRRLARTENIEALDYLVWRHAMAAYALDPEVGQPLIDAIIAEIITSQESAEETDEEEDSYGLSI